MPFQFFDVKGASLCCDVQGEGNPIVLNHSGLGHLEMWNDQMLDFSKRHRVVR